MIDGRFRFDNYVVGSANRLAVSAAKAVVESPGTVYNPLFIYSGSGMGKTHLMGALGFAIRSMHPELHVEYLSLDDFVDQLNAAIGAGQADSFKRRWQSVGALLLDDVQFLTGRTETQSEMLRVLNALQASGRQIVMTSDRPPSEIADVDQRLLTRLAGGLTVDIGAPDLETRIAILQNKCNERSLTFSPGVLEELARNPSANVRELQGALNRLIAQQSIAERPIRAEDVRRASTSNASPEPVDEFASFVSDLAVAVAQTVEEWRVRLGERIAYWSGEGFRTDMLERALELPEVPDVDGLDARFGAACERLRAIEGDAIRLDPKFTGLAVFRDPERLADAEDLLLRAYALCEPPPAPDPDLTLERLVSSPANHLAMRSAAGIVSTPGAQYNPLVITGPAGSGKTHLLHAIGNALRARDKGTWTVACTDIQTFTQELIEALQSDTITRWRARYRACDALLIDDLHLLAGKERAQEELFHLFNAMHDARKQVVFASAVLPSHLTDIASRLRSRLDGGLVVELGRVSDAERIARHTPVPPGDEAAAPTIDTRPTRTRIATPVPAMPALQAREGLDTYFLDPEKLVTDWPDVDGRIVEETH
ncbi:MAG: DnaA/Hda family protein [Gemmatimonadaceae bacterium]